MGARVKKRRWEFKGYKKSSNCVVIRIGTKIFAKSRDRGEGVSAQASVLYGTLWLASPLSKVKSIEEIA